MTTQTTKGAPLFGSWVAGGNPKNGRVKNDFYSTPEEVTQALILAEAELLPSSVWEPCCGVGAMAEVIRRSGRKVWASDLVDRGYGVGNSDFLKQTAKIKNAVVTNPPFEIAEKIIRHSFSLGVDYLALVLKTQFWHAAKRAALFEKHLPSRIYAMTWRPDFSGGGSPTMDCIWCVWDNSEVKQQYKIMRKP